MDSAIRLNDVQPAPGQPFVKSPGSLVTITIPTPVYERQIPEWTVYQAKSRGMVTPGIDSCIIIDRVYSCFKKSLQNFTNNKISLLKFFQNWRNFTKSKIFYQIWSLKSKNLHSQQLSLFFSCMKSNGKLCKGARPKFKYVGPLLHYKIFPYKTFIFDNCWKQRLIGPIQSFSFYQMIFEKYTVDKKHEIGPIYINRCVKQRSDHF